ncbi:putative 2OG-Fe(II) oxygenase [Rheinheimera riviphila]|nr:putative 2OG-Fe(II) oxygenase [Rheinheimera riviphila]
MQNFQMIPLFPTQILQSLLQDAATLNPDLVAEVLQLRASRPGVNKTNVGGWHSPPDLQFVQLPAMQRFVSEINERLSGWAEQYFQLPTPLDPTLWQIELWANCNERGHFNKAHDHFRSGIIASGFYYVRCGGDDVGGETVFINQQSCPLNISLNVPLRTSEYQVTPVDGTLYIFPSWLGHRVLPYRGDMTRISLAFNAHHPALNVFKQGDKPRFKTLKKLLGRADFIKGRN